MKNVQSVQKTNQYIFNRVYKHLYKQNCTAVNEDGDCVYHAEDGTKCAAGCLISDKYYNPSLEGNASSDMEGVPLDPALAIKKSLRKAMDDSSFSLIRAMQRAHDGYPSAEHPDAVPFRVYLAATFQNIAKHYNLNPQVIHDV